MWTVGDESLGSGGTYGFGYDPFGGYAFGVTNQGARVESFYSPRLFETDIAVTTENQFVPDTEVVSMPVVGQTALQPATTAPLTMQSNQQTVGASMGWLGPVALIIAAIAFLK